MSHEFPKLLHQIWLQGVDVIPAKFLPNMCQNKFHNYEWVHVLWDEPKILEMLAGHKSLLDTYQGFSYLHQKVDFAKYVILFMYGGVYVDMDAYCVKSFDLVVQKYPDSEVIVSKTNTYAFENVIWTGNSTMINNGIIAAKPSASTLKILIDHIISRDNHCSRFFSKSSCINQTTGPKLFTQIIFDSIQEGNPVEILDYEYFEPCVMSSGNITDNTICVHNHECSWLPFYLKYFFEYYTQCKLLIIMSMKN
jgi:mannosyltransferase OCH1-like enzyme